MTVTLHWWAIPFGIAVVGLILLLILDNAYSDWPPFVFFASLLIATGICIGHFT